MPKHRLKFDEIGYWSEVKLEIVKKYAQAYSTILNRQSRFTYYYIDGFAGAGAHISKTTGEQVPGSPLNALTIRPPFKHYFFIDLSNERVESLYDLVGKREDVTLREGDCNSILLSTVFPQIDYKLYRRALCLLDPYGLHLNWDVILAAGRSRAIDLFLNFPIMDMNRNTLWTRPDDVALDDVERMTAFWGDESWREAAYHRSPQENLFGEPDLQKTSNQVVVDAFRERLRKVAGFRHVPAPMPMRNSTNAVVYYLFFASPHEVGAKIANEILKSYADRRTA